MEGPFHPAFGYLVKSEAFCLALLESAGWKALPEIILVGYTNPIFPT